MLQSTSIDFLIRIKNAYQAGKKQIITPASNFTSNIAKLLKRYKFIEDFTFNKGVKPTLTIDLSYTGDKAKISTVKIFSKPGRRLYEKVSTLPWGERPDSLIIISTSSGLMSQKEAKVKGLGGELIAEIY